MSITYCHNCDSFIDTDYNAEHFDICGKEEEDNMGNTKIDYDNPPLKKVDLKLMQKCAHKVWQKYDDKYGYRTEKQTRNKETSTDIPYNFWFFWNQFDMHNQRELVQEILTYLAKKPRSVFRLIKYIGAITREEMTYLREWAEVAKKFKDDKRHTSGK